MKIVKVSRMEAAMSKLGIVLGGSVVAAEAMLEQPADGRVGYTEHDGP